LPVKEVVLQSKPFILFLKSHEYYLQTEDLTSVYENVKHEELEISLSNNFSKSHFEKFAACFPKAKFYGFGIEGNDISKLISLPFNFKQKIAISGHPFYLNATNLTQNQVHQFTLLNNELHLKPINKETMLILPKMFIDQIFNEFIKRSIIIIQKDKSTIRTEKTTVILSEDYSLKVSSSHIEELLIV
jgi:hypothetical protein